MNRYKFFTCAIHNVDKLVNEHAEQGYTLAFPPAFAFHSDMSNCPIFAVTMEYTQPDSALLSPYDTEDYTARHQSEVDR